VGRSIAVAVVGSINTDLILRVPRVPKHGENLIAHGVTTGRGGKGSNCAIAVARLGGSAQMVGSVGQDAYGDQAIKALHAEGIATSGVSRCAASSTGMAVIMVDDEGENTIVVARGANERLTVAHVGRALEEAVPDVVVTNYEVPFDCVQAALDWADAHNVFAVLDAGPARHRRPERWGERTVLTGNEAEIACLLGCSQLKETSWQAGVRELMASGLAGVVVKLGGRGAYVRTSDMEEEVPALDVPVVDTTGAGDASTAALALALARGEPWLEAVRFANAAGAVAVTQLGAAEAMPRAADVEALLASAEGEGDG
jgi:ribokinase